MVILRLHTVSLSTLLARTEFQLLPLWCNKGKQGSFAGNFTHKFFYQTKTKEEVGAGVFAAAAADSDTRQDFFYPTDKFSNLDKVFKLFWHHLATTAAASSSTTFGSKHWKCSSHLDRDLRFSDLPQNADRNQQLC